jgi:DNA helicase II / ATP-dependent DNA helicase PcrA
MSVYPLAFLDHLNPEQQKAVSMTQQHRRILAGAGTGKTQVLVCSIVYLLTVEKRSPHEIVAVTFTNKAGKEMKTRLSSLMPDAHYSLWIGTFHHLAHRILRQHHEAAGLEKHFQILDTSDQQRRIKRIIHAMNLDETRFSAKAVQWFINQQKDLGKRPDQLASILNDAYHRTLLDIYRTYEADCRRDQVLDFPELLLRSRELLIQHPLILQSYHDRFRYILVDEFQDTSRMQYEWIRLLTGPESYLTIVGDDDQSIYGWRGAQIENMHLFERDFPNSKTIRLEQNYRSTSTILSGANALIARNQQRLGKNLWTQGESGEPIQIYSSRNEMDEARFIVERIQMLKENGIDYQEIALLYRSNAQSRVLEEALIYANVPYRIYGGLRFFERAEIKDALAYLRLMSHIHDDGAFDRIINTPARGIGEKTLHMIRETAKQHTVSYYQASQLLLSNTTFPTRSARALRGFLDLIEQLCQSTQQDALGIQIEKVLQLSGLIAHYQKDPSEQAQARLDNLNELVYAAQQFMKDTGEEGVLSSFLNKMTLDTGDYQSENSSMQSVQLMTLHAAKGLEFPVVFLTGLEEGLFPSHLALDKPSELEEERRLCYVGMTRAMHQLYLTYAEIRSYRGVETYRIPSRFIEEIPKEYLIHLRMSFSSRFNPSTKKQFIASNPTDQSKLANTDFRLHQRVHHPSFGAGTIVQYEGQGAHTRVQVQFDTVGSKWLILQFAKLECLP